SLRGSALLLTFIYTRCLLPDYCPLITSNFAEIAKELKDHPTIYPATRLLSVTVDPEYDSPKKLREYGSALGSDFAQWSFATGRPEDIRKIATYFGMTYWAEGDQIIHSLRTAVLDTNGKLVRLYVGNGWKTEEILNELRSLTT